MQIESRLRPARTHIKDTKAGARTLNVHTLVGRQQKHSKCRGRRDVRPARHLGTDTTPQMHTTNATTSIYTHIAHTDGGSAAAVAVTHHETSPWEANPDHSPIGESGQHSTTLHALSAKRQEACPALICSEPSNPPAHPPWCRRRAAVTGKATSSATASPRLQPQPVLDPQLHCCS